MRCGMLCLSFLLVLPTFAQDQYEDWQPILQEHTESIFHKDLPVMKQYKVSRLKTGGLMALLPFESGVIVVEAHEKNKIYNFLLSADLYLLSKSHNEEDAIRGKKQKNLLKLFRDFHADFNDRFKVSVKKRAFAKRVVKYAKMPIYDVNSWRQRYYKPTKTGFLVMLSGLKKDGT